MDATGDDIHKMTPSHDIFSTKTNHYIFFGMFFMQPQDEEVDARHDAAQTLYYQADIEEMGLSFEKDT